MVYVGRMPRIPNTRPTSIYWLFDVRPETLVELSNGRPFYCGKTVGSPAKRFCKHRSDARRKPDTLIAKWLKLCGEFVQVRVMETVNASDDWCERESAWISTIHLLHPGGANVTSGGQGAPGYIPSLATRAKRSASLMGRVFSPEHRAKIGIASRNRDPEVYAKIGASQRYRTTSPETRAKISAAGTGKKKSEETRARMVAAAKNRSLERYAKTGAKLKGRVFSAETIARMRVAARRRWTERKADVEA